MTMRGSVGRMECHYHESRDMHAPIVLVLSPDPYGIHGPTNKISYTLYQAFLVLGFKVIQFRYRSALPEEPNVEDELSDVGSCLDWFQNRNTYASRCWVAGFDRGAWLGMQMLMRRPEICSFVSVGAPTETKDFTFLAPCPVPGLFVHAEKDEMCTQDSVSSLIRTLSGQKNIDIKLKTVLGADHFFNNKLIELYQAVRDYVFDFNQKSGSTFVPYSKKPSSSVAHKMVG